MFFVDIQLGYELYPIEMNMQDGRKTTIIRILQSIKEISLIQY